jgi:hypothetical protein
LFGFFFSLLPFIIISSAFGLSVLEKLKVDALVVLFGEDDTILHVFAALRHALLFELCL